MIMFRPFRSVKQKSSLILAGRRVSFRFWYNQVSERWSFDVALDGADVVTGRRIVTGVDLLAPFNLGIGAVFALSTNGEEPTRDALMNGTVRLYHATQEEIDASVPA